MSTPVAHLEGCSQADDTACPAWCTGEHSDPLFHEGERLPFAMVPDEPVDGDAGTISLTRCACERADPQHPAAIVLTIPTDPWERARLSPAAARRLAGHLLALADELAPVPV